MYGEEKPLSRNKFAIAGFDFVGWATQQDGDSMYEDEEAVENLTSTDGEVV